MPVRSTPQAPKVGFPVGSACADARKPVSANALTANAIVFIHLSLLLAGTAWRSLPRKPHRKFRSPQMHAAVGREIVFVARLDGWECGIPAVVVAHHAVDPV